MTQRLGIIVVVLLAAIAVGTSINWYRASQLGTDDDADYETLHNSRVQTSSGNGPQNVGKLTENARDAKVNRAPPPPMESGVDELSSQEAHTQFASSSGGAPADSRPLELGGLSVPEGAPFPVSELIKAECTRLDKSEVGCAHVYRVLKTLERERSDIRWAPGMESRIRASFAVDTSVRITALACRSSVCAVQTEGVAVHSPLRRPLDPELQIVDSIWDARTTSSGERVVEQLLVFDRREKLLPRR